MVMADRVWVGGTSGVWSLAANWSPATVPVAADDVYIVSGSVSITGYDASAVTLGRLVVGSQYTGTIGGSVAKMQISATDFDFSGSQDCYFEGDYTTVTVQDTAATSTALNLSGAGSDNITTLRILGGKGTVNIAASQELTTIEQIGADGVTLNIADAVTMTSATLTMDSGVVEMAEAITAITIFGGELKSTIGSGTVTTLDQYGGRVRWNPSATCTISTLTIYAGLFDSSNSTAPSFVITNTTIHEQGVLNEQSGLLNATFSTALNMEGGEIKYDAGRTVAII